MSNALFPSFIAECSIVAYLQFPARSAVEHACTGRSHAFEELELTAESLRSSEVMKMCRCFHTVCRPVLFTKCMH